MSDRVGQGVLLVRAGACVCALPVADVVETMRPLPVAPLAGTPEFVLGAAVARGEPVPVVDLGRLVGGPDGARTRFVLLRAGARRALLAVDAVLGIGQLPPATALPSLLESAAGGSVDALAAREDELVALLRAARVVPEDAWRALAEAPP